MSAFCTWLQFKYNRETWQFYKILWKGTGHFRPNNRTFRTFQNPDSQTWGSGQNSNTKPIIAIKKSKNQFQKCPKNYTNLKTTGKKGYKFSITYFQFVQRSYMNIRNFS